MIVNKCVSGPGSRASMRHAAWNHAEKYLSSSALSAWINGFYTILVGTICRR